MNLYIQRILILLALALNTDMLFAAQVCGYDNVDAARAEVKEISLRLKIANFRADVGYMDAMKTELKALLDSCQAPEGATGENGALLSSAEKQKERMRQLGLVCDWACFANLGTYYLFMASDYKLLSLSNSAVNAGETQHAEEAAALADEGRDVVELGLRVIARQQGPEASIREFYRQNAVLNNLKLQLQIAKGDVWYQSLSNMAITRIAQGAAESINPATPALGEACTPENKQACALGYAMAYYEDALWSAIEAETDIPAGSAYDDLRISLQEILIDLNRRRDSIRAGHLYLNIDPDAYTNITFEELSGLLRPVVARLTELDAKIQNHIQTWQAEVTNQNYRQIDEANIKKQEGIALKGHQIGLMEAEAASAVAKLNQEKDALDSSMALMDRQKAMKLMEFELQRVQRDIAWQQQQLEARTEKELLALSKADDLQLQGRLRWLINMSITNMNLDMQELALEAQSVEYGRQLENNRLQKDLMNSAIGQLNQQVMAEKENIKIAQLQIDSLNKSKNDYYLSSRHGLRAEICRVELEWDYLGLESAMPDEFKVTRYPPTGVEDDACGQTPTPDRRYDLMQDLCKEAGLYQKLHEKQIDGLVAFYACVDTTDLLKIGGNSESDALGGVSKEAFVSRMQAADPSFELPECASLGLAKSHFNQMKKVVDNELAMIDQEWAGIERSKHHILKINDFKITARITRMNLEDILTAFESIEPTLAGKYIIAAGLASGTAVNLGEQASALTSRARSALALWDKITDFELEKRQFNQQIEELARAADATITRKNLAIYRQEQALLQLGYQSDLDTIKQLYQHRISMNGCQKEDVALRTDAIRLVQSHRNLTSQLQGLLIKNDQIDLDIQMQERRIDQYNNNLAVLDQRIEDEQKKLENLEKDRQSLESLKTNVNKRIGLVVDTRVQVNNLVDQEGSVSERIAQVHQSEADAVFALSAAERVHLDAVLSGEKAKTAELAELEAQIIEDLRASTSISQEISAKMASTKEMVADLQSDIVDASIEINESDTSAEKEQAFLASQEQLASLLPGVPELIKAKRQMMPTVNYVLNLIRSRYRAISGLGNEGFNTAVIQGEIGSGAYVTKVAQVQSIYQNWTEKNILNESPINIEKPVIKIPQSSAFAQQLVEKGRVVFSVNPRVSGNTKEETLTKMADAGYLSLWDAALDNGNPRLVDVMAGFTVAGTSCDNESPNFTLRHMGFGYTYPTSTSDTMELPAIAVGPDVTASQAFLKDVPDLEKPGMSRYKAKLAIWDASPRVNTFDRENQGADAARYLGLPVAAHYELILHKSDCVYDASGDIYLFLAVATDTPN